MTKKQFNLIVIVMWSLAMILEIYVILLEKGDKNTIGVYTQIPLCLIPAFGGVMGVINSRKWGGLKSALGRTLTFLSFGMIFWALGMVGWNYYIFIKQEVNVPYPAFPDYMFFFVTPSWIIGTAFLSSAVGTKFGARSAKAKMLSAVFVVISVLVSYYLLFTVALSGNFPYDPNPLKEFFDVYYPIGTTISLVIAALIVILSHNQLGGHFKRAVYIILIALIVQYFGDFIYTIADKTATYYNGSLSDLLFTTSMAIMALGVSVLAPDNLAKITQSANSTMFSKVN